MAPLILVTIDNPSVSSSHPPRTPLSQILPQANPFQRIVIPGGPFVWDSTETETSLAKRTTRFTSVCTSNGYTPIRLQLSVGSWHPTPTIPDQVTPELELFQILATGCLKNSTPSSICNIFPNYQTSYRIYVSACFLKRQFQIQKLCYTSIDTNVIHVVHKFQIYSINGSRKSNDGRLDFQSLYFKSAFSTFQYFSRCSLRRFVFTAAIDFRNQYFARRSLRHYRIFVPRHLIHRYNLSILVFSSPCSVLWRCSSGLSATDCEITVLRSTPGIHSTFPSPTDLKCDS